MSIQKRKPVPSDIEIAQEAKIRPIVEIAEGYGICDTCIDHFGRYKAKGWGAIAKELGIKPGSKEFKALKDKTAASAEKAKKKKK